MTPLAHRLARQLTLPRRSRHPYWHENSAVLHDAFADTHFFEITGVFPLIWDMKGRTFDRIGLAGVEDMLSPLSFLPAPKTWIEWRWPESPESDRTALHLTETRDTSTCDVTCFGPKNETIGTIHLPTARILDVKDDWKYTSGSKLVAFALWALFFINSPRVIGRQQHPPHKGLERRLSGMFPLHGWTEIKLEVTKPPEIDDGEPHEAHLTGRRALHFCRKHIRIKNGRLEYVRAHWRGDAAIGIKQSRYKVC